MFIVILIVIYKCVKFKCKMYYKGCEAMKNEKLIVKVKKPRGEDGTKTFSIRTKDEILKQIDAIAKRTGRARNEVVNIFLEYALENCEIEE